MECNQSHLRTRCAIGCSTLMIFKTTYTDKNITYEIDKLVGKPYSILQRLTMGGVGSKRMKIIEFSLGMEAYRMRNDDYQFGLIELRPDGILVLINRQHHDFTWAIPYYKLYLYFSNDLTVHAEGNFIKFEDGYKDNRPFIQEIMQRIGKVNGNRIDDM